jgi:hypothetical protein
MPTDGLRASDPIVVNRYLQVRLLFHDHHLARVERLILKRYDVEPTRRLNATLTTHFRGGFARPGEGELWPVVFLTPQDILLGLCVEITAERFGSLGTLLNGPKRLRHRHWEDWWGWEKPLGALHPRFFDFTAAEQEDAAAAWYAEGLEWLVQAGLLRRKVER